MKQQEQKSAVQRMRVLHRNVGFFVVGLVIIYCLSGITLIYRNTTFLKYDKKVQEQLTANLDSTELGKALGMRDFKVTKVEGDSVFFKDGAYSTSTGVANYTTKELPVWMSKLTGLHKASSKNVVHWFTTIFGLLLLFLAVSSFWMFKPSTKAFKRGVYYTLAGVVVAVVLLMLL